MAISKKRNLLLDNLNHNPPLDSRYVEWFSSLSKALNSIKVDDVSEVYILSASKEIDGKTMSFQDAIINVKNYGWGTIICISPSLAVYYGEMGEKSAITRKKA